MFLFLSFQHTKTMPSMDASESQSQSDTSGYLSSSSVEEAYGPMCSTPKQGSLATCARRRVNVYSHTARPMLTIKTKINTTANAASPRVQRSSSDSDIHKIHKSAEDNAWKRKPLIVYDDDLVGVPSASVHCWIRRTYLTQSTSQPDVRVTTRGCPNYRALPRYRLPDRGTVRRDVTKQFTSQQISSWTDSGVSVDESMTEFLANVDKENLAGFLKFYDRVTSASAHDHMQKNTKDYVGTLV